MLEPADDAPVADAVHAPVLVPYARFQEYRDRRRLPLPPATDAVVMPPSADLPSSHLPSAH